MNWIYPAAHSLSWSFSQRLIVFVLPFWRNHLDYYWPKERASLSQYVFEKLEAATGCVPQKKMFLKISEMSQENTCARVSKVSEPANLLKNRLWYRCFPGNFVKFLRTPFLQNNSGRLFLKNKTLTVFLNYLIQPNADLH